MAMEPLTSVGEHNPILADGRWLGQNGIGRFSKEILTRLHHIDILQTGPKPLSGKNLFWQMRFLNHVKKKYTTILTISEYSKNKIVEWTQLPDNKVINVGCGISSTMTHRGKRHLPGYPYFLHVGNTKYHKNIPGLLHAFAQAKI